MGTILNGDWQKILIQKFRTWKEMIVACFSVMSQHLLNKYSGKPNQVSQ
jgi:hypothetical protein